MQCQTGKVPINGICTETTQPDATTNCKKENDSPLDGSDQTCGQCVGTYFLYKGGCYLAGSGTGGKLCTSATDGVCKTPADGYFIPPGATKADQSVVACGETTEVTLKDTKKYKGVKYCTRCAAPPAAGDAGTAAVAICSACEETHSLNQQDNVCNALPSFQCVSGKLEPLGDTQVCTQCSEGYVPINGICTAKDDAANCKKAGGGALDSNAQTCGQCTDAHFLYRGGCYDSAQGIGKKLCTKAAAGVCTTPAAGYFVPPEAQSKDQSVLSCGETTDLVLVSNNKKYKGVAFCSACTAPSPAGDVSTAAAAVCSACQSGYDLLQEENVCRQSNGCAIPGCKTCSSDKKTCNECESGKHLTPTKEACLSSCPAGSYTSGSACSACDPSCATCAQAGADKCTSCYPGSALVYSTDGSAGTCIPECTGAFAEHCAANSCTGKIGGSNYCVKCDNGYAPIDGVCTAVGGAGRAASACTPGDGVCTACTGNYYLLSGGCYQTTKLPGSSVCTEVKAGQNGQCQTCANGQSANGQGVCPSCPDNCATCSTTSTCSACFSGYYLTADTCTKCTENNGEVTGVTSCLSCAAPSSGKGSVICYVKTGSNSTGSGTNLSSGAIAGISVAVIVVVGGLVGFLCWWFVCRGKA
ncbi:VSP [Giardia duodenalis ATCC 50581]|uniref:VSP n=3 Tax=Giardia intestinalis TaxID=5741 RepID=C6LSQ1_GIAIB|nr:VSP [Giardia intestinalis ATCC 50581]